MRNKEITIDGVTYTLTPKVKKEKVKEEKVTTLKPKEGTLGCKDDCIDFPDCHPSCRARWYFLRCSVGNG